MVDCAQIVPVKVKYFQTKPKVSWKIGIESTACNHGIFALLRIWSENPVSADRICPSAPVLMKKDTGNQFAIRFFFTNGKLFDSLNPVLDKFNPHIYDNILEINDKS